MDSEGKEAIDEFYNELMDAAKNADSSLGALEVVVTIKGFERAIQSSYSKELGIDEGRLDQILSKLVDTTEEGELTSETLTKTIALTKDTYDR